MRLLRRYGQLKAMREQGWTKEEFMREFGRNYLDEAPENETEEPDGGFRILEEDDAE